MAMKVSKKPIATKNGHTRTKLRLARVSDSAIGTRLVQQKSTHLPLLDVFVNCSTKRPKTVVETPQAHEIDGRETTTERDDNDNCFETALRLPDNS